jgi:hypothetical protein
MAKSFYSGISTTLTIVRDDGSSQPRGFLLSRVVEGAGGDWTTGRGPGLFGDETPLGNIMRQVESRVVFPSQAYTKALGLTCRPAIRGMHEK